MIALYKSRSGKRTVTLEELQETALCHGWVDTRNKRIDDERYAIRFVPRRASSVWGPKNRRMARRMLEEGLIKPASLASLPDDL